MTPQLRPTLCALVLLCSLSVHAGESDVGAIITALGEINGRALACGHKEVSSRARTIVIARVAKTRTLGEAFEHATNAAFLQQGQTPCPTRPALTVELEATARPLNPPSAHALVQTAETPDTGINPRYLLQAMNGRAIMDGDFKDRFQLITFGYTFCPDICPTSLLEMSEILKQLGDQATRVQTLFFSLDPERDTLEQLQAYTAFFDKRIVAATGKPELVKRAAENFKVRYEKVVEPGGNPQHYAIDHTAGLFLLAPGGQFIAKFPYGTPVASITARLKEEIDLRQKGAAQ